MEFKYIIKYILQLYVAKSVTFVRKIILRRIPFSYYFKIQNKNDAKWQKTGNNMKNSIQAKYTYLRKSCFNTIIASSSDEYMVTVKGDTK